MSLLDEYNDIVKLHDKVLLSTAVDLRADLIPSTPADTGNLRASWKPVEITKDGYKIENSAIYADVRLHARVKVNGMLYGSEQFPMGISPIIHKHDIQLEKDLKAIKWVQN